MGALKRLACRHPAPAFVRNVHGDEINALDGRRSVWRCEECGATLYGRHLHRETEERMSLTRHGTGECIICGEGFKKNSRNQKVCGRPECKKENDRRVRAAKAAEKEARDAQADGGR